MAIAEHPGVNAQSERFGMWLVAPVWKEELRGAGDLGFRKLVNRPAPQGGSEIAHRSIKKHNGLRHLFSNRQPALDRAIPEAGGLCVSSRTGLVDDAPRP
jgi:hypothetical protein